ncbi:MAG: DNA polymerase III subunit beta [Desulfuromonas sp.]|uniref:DNA polymerase III subunit beta n=1 Tax=Desulfuromonas sp. TaxID=892 RepID=UPI000CC1075B|nr:DNA polymerase III subunit beta [Desulfuromonas sp.]PLX83313.1 MAG: DNA polymerase III subunit beta [Desulfuromonas sp.]
MQFKIEKEVFLKGLGRVQGIVEKRNTIPILSNVLIEAGEGEIYLTATDLEVGMRASFPATVTTPGKVTVSAKKIYEIIKELPEKEISFTAKENCWIEIRCGKALFNIVGLSADEFPYFPQPEKELFIRMESPLLKEIIDKTAFSMSTDEKKYNLNGIYFRLQDEEENRVLSLVATDGHRLALIRKKMEAIAIPELQKGVIFPRKGILELKKIAEEGDSDVQIGFMENNAIVKKDQTIVVMRLVDGEFPDFNRVIPQNNDISLLIPRDPFLHALRRMSILTSDKSRGVKVAFKAGLLEISSSNPEFGDSREDLEIDYSGQELSIGFNARYLIDILQSLEEDKIKLNVKDNLSPGLVTPSEGDDFLAVVMPMRL